MRFPVWAIVAMVAATVVLSVATTLIALAVEHLRRSRHAPAAEAEPEPSALAPSVTPGPGTGQAEILRSHPHPAGRDMYRADSR